MWVLVRRLGLRYGLASGLGFVLFCRFRLYKMYIPFISISTHSEFAGPGSCDCCLSLLIFISSMIDIIYLFLIVKIETVIIIFRLP